MTGIFGAFARSANAAPPRRRRTELTTPASRPAMITKAVGSAADCVIIDLEDSVPQAGKTAAREHAREALSLDWTGKSVGVRLNGFGSGHLLDDLEAVLSAVDASAVARLDFLVLPKASQPSDAHWLGLYVDEFELRATRGADLKYPNLGRKIGIELLIESAAGLRTAHELACAHSRVEALVLGPVDYLAALGASNEMVGNLEKALHGPLAHARQAILVAARAAGVAALDMAYPNIGDTIGLTRQAIDAAACGYDGKWVIHPSQIESVNEAFSPSTDEQSRALALLDSAETARTKGAGAFAIAGEMFDEAHLRAARRVLHRTPTPEA